MWKRLFVTLCTTLLGGQGVFFVTYASATNWVNLSISYQKFDASLFAPYVERSYSEIIDSAKIEFPYLHIVFVEQPGKRNPEISDRMIQDSHLSEESKYMTKHAGEWLKFDGHYVTPYAHPIDTMTGTQKLLFSRSGISHHYILLSTSLPKSGALHELLHFLVNRANSGNVIEVPNQGKMDRRSFYIYSFFQLDQKIEGERDPTCKMKHFVNQASLKIKLALLNQGEEIDIYQYLLRQRVYQHPKEVWSAYQDLAENIELFSSTISSIEKHPLFLELSDNTYKYGDEIKIEFSKLVSSLSETRSQSYKAKLWLNNNAPRLAPQSED